MWTPEHHCGDQTIEPIRGIEDEECLASLRRLQRITFSQEKPIDPKNPETLVHGSILNFTPNKRFVVGVLPIRLRVQQPHPLEPLIMGMESLEEGATVNICCNRGDEVGFYLFYARMQDGEAAIKTEPFAELCMDGDAIVRVAGFRTTQLGSLIRVGGNPLIYVREHDGSRREAVNAFAQDKPTKLVAYRQSPPVTYFNGQSDVVLHQREPLIAGESLQDGDEVDVRFVEVAHNDVVAEDRLDARSELRRSLEHVPVIPEYGIKTPPDIHHIHRQPHAKLISAIHARFIMEE